eukprot:1153946-Pelagomonas_calceolata.AAC.2
MKPAFSLILSNCQGLLKYPLARSIGSFCVARRVRKICCVYVPVRVHNISTCVDIKGSMIVSTQNRRQASKQMLSYARTHTYARHRQQAADVFKGPPDLPCHFPGTKGCAHALHSSLARAINL